MNNTAGIGALAGALVTLALAISGSAHAQRSAWVNEPVVTGDGCDDLDYEKVLTFVDNYLGDGLSYGINDEEESGAAMMENYTIASALVLRSQVCLAEALELKKLADNLRKQQSVLTSGTSLSSRQMKRQRKITAKANEEIQETAAEIDELTPEQREAFGQGAAAYLLGTYATGQVFKSVDEYMIESAAATRAESEQAANATKSRFGNIPGADKVAGVAQAGVSIFKRAGETKTVFKGLKDHTVDLYETSQFLRDYSSDNGVALPADATEQLAQVSDWV